MDDTLGNIEQLIRRTEALKVNAHAVGASIKSAHIAEAENIAAMGARLGETLFGVENPQVQELRRIGSEVAVIEPSTVPALDKWGTLLSRLPRALQSVKQMAFFVFRGYGERGIEEVQHLVDDVSRLGNASDSNRAQTLRRKTLKLSERLFGQANSYAVRLEPLSFPAVTSAALTEGVYNTYMRYRHELLQILLEIQDETESLQTLATKYRTKNTLVTKMTGTIFIGHGHSLEWLKLSHFIQNELRLQPEEFSSKPTAGTPTVDRLKQMLGNAMFAFIILTSEDEQANGTLRARQNVVHEAGLFQGRLGFERAIVLLEEGCEEFSNIHGLGQIRFPSGHLEYKFDEIRRVLEREGLLPKLTS